VHDAREFPKCRVLRSVLFDKCLERAAALLILMGISSLWSVEAMCPFPTLDLRHLMGFHEDEFS